MHLPFIAAITQQHTVFSITLIANLKTKKGLLANNVKIIIQYSCISTSLISFLNVKGSIDAMLYKLLGVNMYKSDVSINNNSVLLTIRTN
jgi:hypothetical protein